MRLAQLNVRLELSHTVTLVFINICYTVHTGLVDIITYLG